MTIDTKDRGYLIDSHSGEKYAEKNFFLFFSPLINEYRGYLETHGRKKITVQNNLYHLQSIEPAAMEVCGGLTFEEIGEAEIYRILDGLSEFNLHTRRVYLEAFGRLLKFATGRNVVKDMGILWSESPTRRIFIQADKWPLIKAQTRDSLDDMILCLGARMGLRSSEMVRIRLSDIQGDNLVIHGKGHGKDGAVSVVQMPMEVQRTLRSYLDDRAEIRTDSDQLLIWLDGRTKGRPLCRDSINVICDTLSDRSGIKFTPHSLRRLFATTLYDVTEHDLETTARLTRHRDTNVLMTCYIEPNAQKARSALDRLAEVL